MPDYLIWSEEHGAWWNPNGMGYTRSMQRAGRYSKADAERISDNANAGGTFCEVPVKVTDAMALLCERKSGGR